VASRSWLSHELPNAFVKRVLSDQVGTGGSEAFVIARRPFPKSSWRIEIDVRVEAGRLRVVVGHFPFVSRPISTSGWRSMWLAMSAANFWIVWSASVRSGPDGSFSAVASKFSAISIRVLISFTLISPSPSANFDLFPLVFVAGFGMQILILWGLAHDNANRYFAADGAITHHITETKQDLSAWSNDARRFTLAGRNLTGPSSDF
jgi:hypothetical protein